MPVLNTASWTVRQLGKTRSTVSATYMCSHIVTICLVVPEVSSSYHKKHCHIKHPADTETTEWGNKPTSCWAIRLWPQNVPAKNHQKIVLQGLLLLILFLVTGFPLMMILLQLTLYRFAKQRNFTDLQVHKCLTACVCKKEKKNVERKATVPVKISHLPFIQYSD